MLLQVYESKIVLNYVDDMMGVINVGYFKEFFVNCIELNSRLDEEKNLLKGYILRLNKIGVVMVDFCDNIVVVDCLCDDVYGVINILVDFSDFVVNCVIYILWKFCFFCIKLMV